MMASTVEIILPVVPVCIRLPLTSSHIGKFCTSALSSRVTSYSSVGPKVSHGSALLQHSGFLPAGGAVLYEVYGVPFGFCARRVW
jgi:hypothetical protein